MDRIRQDAVREIKTEKRKIPKVPSRNSEFVILLCIVRAVLRIVNAIPCLC